MTPSDGMTATRAYLPRVLQLTMFGLVYFVAARVSLLFVIKPEGIAGVWLAGGVGLAFLLGSKKREWPAVLGIIFFVNVLTNLITGNSLAVSLGFGLANTIEPALAAGLIVWRASVCRISKNTVDPSEKFSFSRLTDISRLVMGAVIGTGVAGLVGALTAHLEFGSFYWSAWRVWWTEGALGMLIITPLVARWLAKNFERPVSTTGWWIEMILVTAVASGSAWYIFGSPSKQILANPYLLFPFVLWAALRLGQRGVSILMAPLASIILISTTWGIGNFPLGGTSQAEQLVVVQMFLSITSITGLMLAALFNERGQALETLRASEARYRAIVHTTQDGFLLTDRNGVILEVNDALCGITGFTREELLGKKALHLDLHLTPEQAHTFARQDSTGTPVFFETQYHCKNGKTIEIEISSSYQPMNGGHYVAFVHDITPRKQRERALRESEARWQYALEGAGDGLWDWNTQTRQVYFSRQWKAMLGYAEDEVGDSLDEWSSRVHPDDLEKTLADVQQHLDGLTPVYVNEHRVRAKNGEYRWILDRGKVVDRMEDGKPLRVIGTHSDVTERRMLEERLRLSESVLRLFVDYAPAAIAMFDREMRYMAHSLRYLHDYRILGQTIIGRSHYHVFPEIPMRWIEIHNRCLAGAIEKCENDPFPRIDGSIDWVNWEIHPWYDSSGEIGGIVLFSEVNTARKIAEDQLRLSEQNLRKSQQVAHVGSWAWVPGTNQLVWSDEMYRIFGISRETFTGDLSNVIQRAIHPDDQKKVHLANKNVIDQQRPGELEYRVVWPDGTVRWVWAAPGESTLDANGSILKLTGIVQDITERRMADEQLRKSEERLRALFEHSPISIWEEDFSAVMAEIHRLKDAGVQDLRSYLDQNSEAVMGMASLVRVLDFNQQTVDLFEIDKQEMIRFGLPSIFTEESLKVFKEEIIALSEGSTTFHAEIPTQTGSGKRKVLAFSLVVVPGYEADNSKLLLSFIDVTEQRVAEEEIRMHNRLLETIREILFSLSAEFKLEPIFAQAVRGALDLTGLESSMLLLVNPENQSLTLAAHENVPEALLQAHKGREIFYGECLCTRASLGQPVVFWDHASDAVGVRMAAAREAGMRFFAALPLMNKGQCIGVLSVFSRDDRQPPQYSLDLLENLCGPFALAIENARLFEQTRRDAARADALARMAARLIAPLDIGAVVNTVCEEAALAMGLPAANLLLYEDATGMMRMAAEYGFSADYLHQHQPFPIEEFNLLTDALGLPVLVPDLRALSDLPNIALGLQYNIRSLLGVRITRENKLVGMLSVFTKDAVRSFTADDIELLQGLADQAAQAIDNVRLFGQVSAGRSHLRSLSQKLVEVQEAERRALALELHDELGQVLNSVKMSLDMIPQLSPDVAHRQLTRAKSLVSDLVVRVRHMSLELRPSMLDDMGLLPALRWLFKSYHEQTGEIVSFKCSDLEQRFSPQVEITAYRICQEALTNVSRHADTKRVYVEMFVDDQALNIQIGDQGQGFDLKTISKLRTSSGLSGMRERARLIGGDLVVESQLGVGTTITARLPFLVQ